MDEGVSGPSRELGGFLRHRITYYGLKLENFPAPIEDWVVSYLLNKSFNERRKKVSGPSRGMGSFLRIMLFSYTVDSKSLRPLSRYRWFPT